MVVSQRDELDGALSDLEAGAGRWARLPLAAKRALLLELNRGIADVAAECVEVACGWKGIAMDSPLAGEE